MSSSNSKTGYELAIDLSADGVTMALVRIGAHPAIVETLTERIPFTRELAYPHLQKELAKVLHHTLEYFVRESGTTPDRVHVFLASPWFLSYIREVSYSRPKPFVLTEKLVADIARKERSRFESNELRSIGMPAVLFEHALVTIESAKVPLFEPYGTSLCEVMLRFHFGVADANFMSLISETIRRSTAAPILAHSFPFAASVVARELAEGAPHFAVIDSRGEIADVVYSAHHSMTQTLGFPFGHRKIARSLMDAHKVPLHEAESHIELYHGNTLGHPHRGNVEIILSSEREQFRRTLRALVTAHQAKGRGILTLFVVATPVIRTLIESELNTVGRTAPIQVIFLHPGLLAPHVGHEGKSTASVITQIEALSIARIKNI